MGGREEAGNIEQLQAAGSRPAEQVCETETGHLSIAALGLVGPW